MKTKLFKKITLACFFMPLMALNTSFVSNTIKKHHDVIKKQADGSFFVFNKEKDLKFTCLPFASNEKWLKITDINRISSSEEKLLI